MSTYDIFQVDAFASSTFTGNPAAVVPLNEFLTDQKMQEIAAENNLSETAFFVKKEAPNSYDLRWFTPNGEVRLCGHATLATAFVINYLSPINSPINFNTKSGILQVEKVDDRYVLDFPSDRGAPASEQDIKVLDQNLILDIIEGKDDLMIVTDEESLKKFNPDSELIAKLKFRGLILTSRSEDYDFISRCFYPKYNIPEDPVTGSAHTLLTPYWAMQLKKNKMIAKQISKRGGIITCVYKGSRVSLIGEACLYMKGQIYC